LAENQAHTHAKHPDGTLRGRTYAIPFSQVWFAVLELASKKLRGWTVTEADEDAGVLRAECKATFSKKIDDVVIRMSLDENALTRVDMSSASRGETMDFGRNVRRVRRFFPRLDKRVEAGPGQILDPTIPLAGVTLLISGFLGGCEPGVPPPPETATIEADTTTVGRNFDARSYERHIVFLTVRGDSTLLVPLSFSARTQPGGVSREIRGWLARGETWDPFLAEKWDSPPNSAPWRILPRGSVRLIVGQGDALETILFQEGGRNLEMNLGELLVEWSGQQAQVYRVHEGSLTLSDQTVEGNLLDLTRAWAADDEPPGDWGFLVSGDSLHAVMEDLQPGVGPEGGAFTVRARVSFLDRQWQGVRFVWSEVRAFEAARRDVPLGWEIQSLEGDLEGTLTSTTPFLEAVEGEGPVLPAEGLFLVSGTLTLDGADYPVHGFIRHRQR
jgi:hypothetical protein